MLDIFKYILLVIILSALVSSIWLDYMATQRKSKKQQDALVEEMYEKQFRDRMTVRKLWEDKQFWIREVLRNKK